MQHLSLCTAGDDHAKLLDLLSFTLGAHMQKGYSTCLECVSVSVCLCVCLLPLQCQHRSFLHSE